MMTAERKRIVTRLRRLGKTKTQAESARALDLERQWVHKLASLYGIKFKQQKVKPKPMLCPRCDFRKIGSVRCLRCYWTPARIKKLREKYGLSQVAMSYVILKMNVWACTRWENGGVTPSRRALEKLELANDSPNKAV